MFLSEYCDNVWNYHEDNIWVDHEYEDRGEVTQVFDFCDWYEKLDDESLTDIAGLPENFAIDLRQVIDKAVHKYIRDNSPYSKLYLKEAAE